MPQSLSLVQGSARGLGTAVAVGSGGAIDLNGTSSSLDWDTRTGDPSVDFDIVRPGPDLEHTGADDEPTGLVYRACDDRLTGALRSL